MKAPKKIYVCTECDAQSPKWLGRCPVCGAWNSLIEETFAAPAPSPAAPYAPSRSGPASNAVPIDELDAADCDRTVTGIRELDRVLGGGIVLGGVVLLGGEFSAGSSPKVLGTIKSQYMLGDVDLDGSVMPNDAYTTLQMYVGLLTNYTNAQFMAADVDFDSQVMPNDAYKILQYYVGLITEF